MTMDSPVFDFVRPIALDTRDDLIREAQRGLSSRPRSLAPWIFYDACGSRLFERITHIPEYYPTRTERKILANYADAIIAGTHAGKPKPVRLLELGAGTASKTCLLLEALGRVQSETLYIPIDVSPDALEVACEKINACLPDVCVEPIVSNYVTHPARLTSFNGTTLAAYIGSSIGNFSPEEARTVLRTLRSELQPGDALLLGTDMVKDEKILVDAYDDKGGVTAAFNLNILRRLNRELGADFDPAKFRHRAVWNHLQSRIEMHLESTFHQRIKIPEANLDFRLTTSETIHTENSYKFTHESIGILVEQSGFHVEQSWTDERDWYAVTLARCQ
jgi:dimethylhistidine N-methyltransferase